MVFLQITMDPKAHMQTFLDSGAHFTAFFSTIWGGLEQKRWGSRFPVTMNKLYAGEVPCKDVRLLEQELHVIQNGLRNLSATHLVWNFECLDEKPPVDAVFSNGVHTCEDFFMFYNDCNLFPKIFKAIEHAIYYSSSIEVHSSYDYPWHPLLFDNK